MLAAIQALYSEAKLLINFSGCIGDSELTVSSVKQGCPLSPTLFGILIDALEGWLAHKAPAAGVRVRAEGGGSRRLPVLIYADDLALLASSPSELQALIDALAEFCGAAGLEVSAAKTQVMQFAPLAYSNQPPFLPHSFQFGSDTAHPVPLDNTAHYKYLGVHFSSTGNPKDYMLRALQNMPAAYASMRQRYCSLACGWQTSAAATATFRSYRHISRPLRRRAVGRTPPRCSRTRQNWDEVLSISATAGSSLAWHPICYSPCGAWAHLVAAAVAAGLDQNLEPAGCSASRRSLS